MKKMILFVLAMLASSSVYAHPGHAEAGFTVGFLHPLTGVDHLLVMLAIGFWAGKQARLAWVLPLLFMTIMTLAATLGMLGWRLPFQETAVAASVLAFGVILLLNQAVPSTFQMILVSGFALFHGLAHGAEFAPQQQYLTFAGMLFATALLHVAGYAIARFQYKRVRQALGLVMLAVGGILLVS